MRDRLPLVHFGFRVLVVVGLSLAFLAIFSPFWLPILLAGFFALGLEPLLSRIFKKIWGQRQVVSAALIVLVPLILFAPFVVFALRIAQGLKGISTEALEQSQILQSLLDLLAFVQNLVTDWVENLGIKLFFLPRKEEILDKIAPIIMDSATNFLSRLPTLGMHFFVFFAVLFVFMTYAPQIKQIFVRTNLLPEADILFLAQELKNACSMTLFSIFLVGGVQAFIVGIGSQIFGFHEFFLIFCVTLFFSFIPVIGAGPVAALLAIIAFLMGHIGNGIGMLVVTLIAATIDNVLKPIIFSRAKASLHPIMALFGLIGAIIIFGLPGLLIGPFLLQVTLTVVPELMQRLLRNR